ncbi:MAG: hypothetical protein KGJ73_11365, partial [Rhodospirillales bacterium]|nr:hypothetical protein [Rhodospirillales bacterium]
MAGDEEDPDATIVWRPGRVLPQSPAPEPQPEPAPQAEAPEPIPEPPPLEPDPEPEPASPPLRDAVLAGAFFGAAHA